MMLRAPDRSQTMPGLQLVWEQRTYPSSDVSATASGSLRRRGLTLLRSLSKGPAPPCWGAGPFPFSDGRVPDRGHLGLGDLRLRLRVVRLKVRRLLHIVQPALRRSQLAP